ncbi:MAG: TAT-variant-translocated molybdopterin oxidoreductase [Ferruginibacter sp.]
MNKKYWQSFGELTQSENHQKTAQNEFQEELLPLAELDGKGILDAATPRRDFLKYLGFSTAAAAIAASCQTPVKKTVPYLSRPDDIIPGVPNYYASTYINGGDAISVVVKQRDGRPIKIEGNELSTVTKGGTSAQAQASVLDLYDPTRLRHPLQKSGNEFKEVSSFDAFDKMVAGAVAAQGGKAIVLLTSTINSPSTLQVISEFLAKYPGSRHVQYDPVSYSGILQANELSYGKRAIPSYHFDKAKTIVSLGADFLGTWVSPTEFSKQYAENRKVKSTKPELSRHIHFESMMSMTGSNADDRYTHKPSQTGAVALALAAALGVPVPAQSTGNLSPKVNEGILKTAAALKASQGQALVVSGSNDVNVQVIVNAINEAIGANGTTINWAVTTNSRKGIDSEIVQLVNDMNAGTIGTLMVYGVNPAYSYSDSKKFIDGLNKVPVTVSFSGTLDETTEQCKYILPSHHWLESWGDAEPKSGYISLMQPTINPLFKTRPFQTSLLKWAANPTDYETYFKNYWAAKLGSTTAWDKALQDGVIEPATASTGSGAFNGGAVAAAAGKLAAVKAGTYEVVLYEKISIGNGSQANNPWLQEVPDPISKVTWDNYAMISPGLAKELLKLDVLHNQREADKYEVTPEKPVLKITVNGKAIELPALIIPGLDNSTIAIAVGYGRSSANQEQALEWTGRAAVGAGKNAYPLVTSDGTTFLYSAAATVEKSGAEPYPLAQTQVHGSSENRPILFETNLESYTANPAALLAEATEEREMVTPHGKTDFVKDATIYPDYAKPGIKWGMSIDLNTCTGCSACVVACTAENNVSVVGKIQVQRAHEMHWLRIDRYFTGDMESPDVVYQPMLCQHCDNAPCENVCPVAATNHSSEGLNQMTYNRCIGTRYCANNCPYKVRRFNWLDYNGADSFPDNQKPLVGTDTNEVILQMNDDLTRMVLNPDVTVRGRGVIEKCSFCVQRLQESKLNAKKAQDPSLVRNVKVACSQACPSDCITFGNVNDPESDVSKARKDATRNFYVLETLHVLPNVSYLAKIRNTDREIGHHEEEGHAEAKHEAKEEHAPAAH